MPKINQTVANITFMITKVLKTVVVFSMFCQIFILTGCKSTYKIKSLHVEYSTPYYREENQANLNSLSDFLVPYRDSLKSIMNDVIGESDLYMEKGVPESLLGNFVSDLCFSVINSYLSHSRLAEADFLIFNNGGLRSSIVKGEITRGAIFSLMPFDNELVVISLPYDSINSLINYIRLKEGVPLAGITISDLNFDASQVKIANGKRIAEGEIYHIATSDFLARGGDGMTMFTIDQSPVYTGIKVRDAIIGYIESEQSAGRKINSRLDGRITK